MCVPTLRHGDSRVQLWLILRRFHLRWNQLLSTSTVVQAQRGSSPWATGYICPQHPILLPLSTGTCSIKARCLLFCAGITQIFSQGWQETKPEARTESRAFSTRSPFHFDPRETTATKGNAIQGHTAHHIHIDAGAEITVFIDNPLSQR